MAGNDCIPYKEPGERVTATTTAGVLGKHLVVITGPRTSRGLYSVGPAGANAPRMFGVAGWDAVTGKDVTVYILDADSILPILSGAAVTAGAAVTTDANGAAVTATAGQNAFGIAVDSVAGSGLDLPVLLRPHVAV